MLWLSLFLYFFFLHNCILYVSLNFVLETLTSTILYELDYNQDDVNKLKTLLVTILYELDYN